MKNKEKILRNLTSLPVGLNKVLLSLNVTPGLFYGKGYLKNKRELDIVNWKSGEEKLLNIVNHSIKSTPYYSGLYNKPVSNIDEFSDSIGFIDKNILTEHFDELISTDIRRDQFTEVTTGGTSGKPARFLIPGNRHTLELSTMHTMWNRTGWDYDTRAVLRNHHLREGEIFRINPVSKEFIFDNFRLSPAYVKQIHEIMVKHHIRFIHAYPSAAYQFCLYCRELGLDLGFIKAFLCGSEGIMDFQRKLIAEEMGLRIYSWYGHSEKLVLGGYCEHTDHYHIEPGYGYFELIDENNKPVDTTGKVGEIVGSTLHNYGMPLIRYRTGDFAEYVADRCEKCGRKMTIIRNVQGRRDKHQIYKKDGSYITTTALNLHDELYKYIDGLQYVQEDPGSLRVLIMKGNSYRNDHELMFKNHFVNSMGPDSKVIIQYVDRLILQPNGKFVELISNLENKK